MENHLKCFPRFLLEIHNFLQRRAITPTLFSHFNAGSRIYIEIFTLITEQRPNQVTRGLLSPRIKVRTDWYGLPMRLLRSRRIKTFKLYFSSHERVSLFERDDRRFCKDCFQQGLTLMFHRYLFKIVNCRVVRCDLLAFVYDVF